MSMILDLASAARGAFDHVDTTQAVDVLARGGGRRSTHFFFFGGGAGLLLWIPILGLAFLYQFVKRNPDKARMYKDRLKENFAGASSGGARPSSAPTAPDPVSAALVPGAPGRPPRLRLPTGAGAHPPVAPAPPAPPTTNRPWMQHAGTPRERPRPTAPPPRAMARPERGAVKSVTATWSFNPPPQWPLRPGFTPGHGWTPDPSWPPAPPGWRFWTQNR